MPSKSKYQVLMDKKRKDAFKNAYFILFTSKFKMKSWSAHQPFFLQKKETLTKERTFRIKREVIALTFTSTIIYKYNRGIYFN